jgi:hypothetical protein
MKSSVQADMLHDCISVVLDHVYGFNQTVLTKICPECDTDLAHSDVAIRNMANNSTICKPIETP